MDLQETERCLARQPKGDYGKNLPIENVLENK